MEQGNRTGLPLAAWLRAALCVALSLVLLAAYAPLPASVLGGLAGTAWAVDDDSDDDDGGDGADEPDAPSGGADIANAARKATTKVNMSASSISKVDHRYLYTRGKFTVIVAEGAGGFIAAERRAGKNCTSGVSRPFKCANYVEVTFGIACKNVALNPANTGRKIAHSGTSAKNPGKAIYSGNPDATARLDKYITKDSTVLVWIESQRCVGDRSGDADAPKVELKGMTKSKPIYGDYGSKGYKTVDCIECPLAMSMSEDDEANTIANKISLVYKNKAVDQVFWQKGHDPGNNTEENDKGDKLYSWHRFAFYEDNGNDTNAYNRYTGYNFRHAASGASSCKVEDVDFNVTINLASTGAMAAGHAKNSGTHAKPKNGGHDHCDRIVNEWACIRLKQPSENVSVDLGGGSIAGLDASTAADNELFTNYTLNGTKAENEAGTKKGTWKTLANGSTITLGVPKKEGAKFLGWAWEKVDKNLDSAYTESGQNRTSYSDSKFRAAYAKKFVSLCAIS